MDGDASRGFSGGGLPPRPTVAPTRRRPFVAPHPRPTPHSSQERPSPGGGGSGLPPRLPNEQPRLGPHALTFTEPHAATWDAGSTTTSPAHVYEVAGDFSPNHWMPDDYSVSCANVKSSLVNILDKLCACAMAITIICSLIFFVCAITFYKIVLLTVTLYKYSTKEI